MAYVTLLSLVSCHQSPVHLAQQPDALKPISGDHIRNLTWGQLNILHTTDTHGWLPGHLLEPVFSADWGDLYSFVYHMKALAKEKGVDLLFVDSGDRHDGNGLSDATIPLAVITEKMFTQQDYDIVTIGNHELYKYESALMDYLVVGKHYGENYVVSNVDIFINNTWHPMGNRYRRFTTEAQQLNIVAFGFLFNFRGNALQTRVTLVEDAIKEKWFEEALSYNDTDVFVIAAHIPLRFFPEMKIITNAIRRVHPKAVIQFLGGHSHIRDFAVIDENAVGLQSGRFMETVGWTSVDGISTKEKGTSDSDVLFSRTYIDTNLNSYMFHSNTSSSLSKEETNGEDTRVEFNTKKGIAITNRIADIRKQLRLDDVFGCVPRSFLLNRAKYPGPNSLFTLLEEVVLPRLIGKYVSKWRSLIHPRYIIINTGSIRFDLFKGPYTRDSGYIVSPFKNNWLYLPDVPMKYAKKILPELNKLPYILSASANSELDPALLNQGKITLDSLPKMNYAEMNIPQSRSLYYLSQSDYEDDEKIYEDSEDKLSGNKGQNAKMDQNILKFQNEKSRHNKLEESNLYQENYGNYTPGYVTYDDYGDTGDDTVHKGWKFYYTPNAIQAEQNIPSEDDDNLIDVVFYDFIKPFILDALAKIEYHNTTVLPYGGSSTVEMLTGHVAEFWASDHC